MSDREKIMLYLSIKTFEKMPNIFSAESFKSLFGSFINSFRRFPLTLLCSFVATFCVILIAKDEAHSKELERLAVTFGLFLPLFFSAEIFEERKQTPKFLVLGLSVLAIVTFYFFGFPDTTAIFNNKSFLIRSGVLLIVFHLLVSVAPYIFKNNPSGFWQYNKTLFINILTAFLYTGTLTVGLLLAVGGTQNLFELKIDDDWYVYIWFGVNGFFNTLIFTSKLPALEQVDSETSFPIGLKYFTQYVLLPLVAIFLTILLAYEAKIVLAWSLPKGWVSIMVLASAIFGILAFLLIYPLKNLNKWIQSYNKAYYWILIPLVGLMLVAIYFRISQYGLTEPRYFVAMLAVWLLGIAIYFSFSKVDNIKVIPLSLLIIGLLGIYAPFNAFQSSRTNQIGRMELALIKGNLLKAGKITVPDNFKPDSINQDKLYAALEYLAESYPERLEKYLTEKQFEELTAEKNDFQRAQLIYKLTNLPHKKSFDVYKYFSVKRPGFYDLNKADFLIDSNEYGAEKEILKLESDSLEWQLEKNTLRIIVSGTERVNFDLSKLKNENSTELGIETTTFEKESSKYSMKLLIESGNSNNGILENLQWKLFLSKKL
jgi:Domain of unknown function (DUF4153)